ncbi:unnamed protein product, partial [Cuscuta campestris]
YKRAFGGPLLRCLTRAEAERVIAEVHEGVCAAHQMSRTLAQRIILLGYFWPTMNQDCEKYVQRCKTFQVFYKFPGRPATYSHPVSNVIPFARFGMDIIGAFPQAQGRKKYVMVAIDYFTKWVEAEAYATITTKKCQRFVWKNIITRFGSPRNIVTDNGPQFWNPGFTKYLEDFGITHNKAFVAYPQGNGQVENANRTIVDGIKKRLGEAGTNWLEELPHIIWAYRVTSRRATRETPFVITYGCEARLPIEAKIMTFREKIYEEKGNEEDHLAELNLLEERRMVAEAKMIEYQQAAKAYHDNRVGPRYFQVGDEVLRRREASKPSDGGKLAKKWEGPYRVKAILRPGTYKLETMEGRELERITLEKFLAGIFKLRGRLRVNPFRFYYPVSPLRVSERKLVRGKLNKNESLFPSLMAGGKTGHKPPLIAGMEIDEARAVTSPGQDFVHVEKKLKGRVDFQIFTYIYKTIQKPVSIWSKLAGKNLELVTDFYEEEAERKNNTSLQRRNMETQPGSLVGFNDVGPGGCGKDFVARWEDGTDLGQNLFGNPRGIFEYRSNIKG